MPCSSFSALIQRLHFDGHCSRTFPSQHLCLWLVLYHLLVISFLNACTFSPTIYRLPSASPLLFVPAFRFAVSGWFVVLFYTTWWMGWTGLTLLGTCRFGAGHCRAFRFGACCIHLTLPSLLLLPGFGYSLHAGCDVPAKLLYSPYGHCVNFVADTAWTRLWFLYPLYKLQWYFLYHSHLLYVTPFQVDLPCAAFVVRVFLVLHSYYFLRCFASCCWRHPVAFARDTAIYMPRIAY